MRLALTLVVVIHAAGMQTAAPPSTALKALTEAEARWEQRRPSAYEFDVEVRCFCVGLLQKPVSFRVRNTEVRSLQDLGLDASRTYGYYDTVEKLFAALRRSLARGEYKVAIEYDADLGYPVKADVDPKQTTFDDELFFKVTSFRKIEADALRLRPTDRAR